MKQTELSFSASLRARVNDCEFIVRGNGTSSEETGVLRGKYKVGKLPRGMDPLILTAFLVTGYPGSSRSLSGTSNVFKGVSFKALRTLDFEDGKELVLSTACRRLGTRMMTEFRLTGSVSVPKLVSVEPVVETWIPNGGPGKVYGHFSIAWRTTRGKRIRAEATTRYDVDTKQILVCTEHRYIGIRALAEGNILLQDEQSILFDLATLDSQ